MLLEAALSIQSGEDSVKIVLMLHSMADIPENPVTSAIEDYLRTGDKNIFELALEKLSKEEFYFVSKSESYEIERFLDQAYKVSDTARRYGLEGAAEMITKSNEPLDMFDYGILMAADGYETVFIEKILNNYSVLETEPAFQTLAKMKKSAVLSIVQGDNPRILVLKLYSLYTGAIRNDRCPHLRD
jgi:flagellar motor component MotA